MVPRVVAWSLLALVVLVLLIVPWIGSKVLSSGDGSSSSKQTGDSQSSPAEIGRFQIVRQSAEEIVLLDTTTGELYKAAPGDIQPYEKLAQEEQEDEE